MHAQTDEEYDEEERIIQAAMARAEDPEVQRESAEVEERFFTEYERRIASGEIIPPEFKIPPLWEM